MYNISLQGLVDQIPDKCYYFDTSLDLHFVETGKNNLSKHISQKYIRDRKRERKTDKQPDRVMMMMI